MKRNDLDSETAVSELLGFGLGFFDLVAHLLRAVVEHPIDDSAP